MRSDLDRMVVKQLAMRFEVLINDMEKAGAWDRVRYYESQWLTAYGHRELMVDVINEAQREAN